MDAHIKEISDKISTLRARLKLHVDTLNNLRELCEHAWHYDGHGHNSKFYTCNKCGETKDE